MYEHPAEGCDWREPQSQEGCRHRYDRHDKIYEVKGVQAMRRKMRGESNSEGIARKRRITTSSTATIIGYLETVQTKEDKKDDQEQDKFSHQVTDRFGKF